MRMLFLLAAALAAGATAAAGERPRRTPKSPNDMICREVEVSGSRLDSRRICMTRLQWEEQRRDAREAVEKAQTQQINPTG